MTRLAITSNNQRIFAAWVKNRYDTGIYHVNGLKKGEYENLQSICETGTYDSSAVKVLNILRRNCTEDFQQYMKAIRQR